MHHRKGGCSHGLKSKGRGRKHHGHGGHGGHGRHGGHHQDHQDHQDHRDHKAHEDHKDHEDLFKETGHKKKHGRHALASEHGKFDTGDMKILYFHKRKHSDAFRTGEREFQGRSDVKASVNLDRCVMCGKCQRVCPTEAIIVTEGTVSIDANRCIGCGHCVERCKKGAMFLVERKEAMMS